MVTKRIVSNKKTEVLNWNVPNENIQITYKYLKTFNICRYPRHENQNCIRTPSHKSKCYHYKNKTIKY